jgi:hypothetical protein
MFIKNFTKLSNGIFRTANGNSDELIAIGRAIKAGYIVSKVENTNSKYDAVIDPGNNKKLLRVQIKGSSDGKVSFTGGGRSGAQISRTVGSREKKYTVDDCDIILAINSNDGECYIIPVVDITNFGKSKSLKSLEKYKENWGLIESNF